ncbi:bifunctional diaminohydroxyphosphoribosylaminopyrimidine deaminase/5-amino-6-(5-phosphoribosylamino)uracil reductase RibD [Alteribacter natronophilus]|uniref:bifunctional diaminohydroxyphosphoribosylaminopyrimidine deaminase/5-amino-6-(5-phosphoribosylamino)uracil reductase RibD n=1 Tax=Alteribacter natronophilus TaxID=2583810 RepID=UPI00110EE0E0|nr:bifunctional diaminohydroxyphosphoribosylaminopyrimidine deaminase/5-amino-6-(5-phosphoribosylamino)uracil reductase RibD [Alteribacter natronophilus]TMW73667.1 bifunctional diaminohydroxyphosphoribosylaminopyrimidine deaminase/5-amino-6-(5-phosphoribosylamino)uracil reductase RibD [Alteribacter natronophilus]
MNDEAYMKLALGLARSTIGQTSPNPAVGAVLVKNNEVVGMGAHLRAGEPHAERHALTMAGEKSKGAVMYVTLEPCAHYGRTPPCAEALIEAEVSRVVVGTKDPDERVAGRGIRMLRDAGISVTENVCVEEARELNRMFFHSVTEKRPFVTLKTASSLDGKIATKTGESKWITGEAAREDVHRLRHEHDAILVGVNTVIADDPSLTVRLPGGGRHPVRVVLDHNLRTPADAGMIQDGLAPVWIVSSQNGNTERKSALEEQGAKVFELGRDTVEIAPLLTLLGEQQIRSVLVEGGGSVNDSFLRSGLFEQVIVYIAPLLIGGEDARSSFAGSGIRSLTDAAELSIQKTENIGRDLKITAVREGNNVYRNH